MARRRSRCARKDRQQVRDLPHIRSGRRNAILRGRSWGWRREITWRQIEHFFSHYKSANGLRSPDGAAPARPNALSHEGSLIAPTPAGFANGGTLRATERQRGREQIGERIGGKYYRGARWRILAAASIALSLFTGRTRRRPPPSLRFRLRFRRSFLASCKSAASNPSVNRS